MSGNQRQVADLVSLHILLHLTAFAQFIFQSHSCCHCLAGPLMQLQQMKVLPNTLAKMGGKSCSVSCRWWLDRLQSSRRLAARDSTEASISPQISVSVDRAELNRRLLVTLLTVLFFTSRASSPQLWRSSLATTWTALPLLQLTLAMPRQESHPLLHCKDKTRLE